MNEWEIEPNRKHWIDSKTGLDCLIVRNIYGGYLCGYVGVPSSHPWYSKDYDECDADVHGGLTYAAKCKGHICHHSPQDAVANDDVWWLGFDCAHLGDLSPWESRSRGVYKNMAYVERECAALASQIRKVAKP
jgi:hypothetical protein